MTKISENMVFGMITFILITWTISLIFLMYKIDKDMDYLHTATEYHGQVLKTIEINMEPISQFKGLTKYRTFSCKIGEGQIYYD
jgi:hypothetical protein